MITVRITGLDSTVQNLRRLARDQLPYATARALTKTVQEAAIAQRREMERVFDRPTPYALNSLRTVAATKTRLQALLALKDEAGKGTPAPRVLGPHFLGGARAMKRSELALRRIGMLAGGEVMVPGAGAQLDAYGNMRRAQLTQVLAWVQAFGEQGYKANTTAAQRTKRARGTSRTRGVGYYFKRDAPGRGIYMRVRTGFGSAIKPVLLFVRQGSYRRRLNMAEVVEHTVRTEFPRAFSSAFAEAVRTARG